MGRNGDLKIWRPMDTGSCLCGGVGGTGEAKISFLTEEQRSQVTS